LVKLARLKSGTYKKVFTSESIYFEASIENTKTSNIIPDSQIDFIYDIVDGKVVRTQPGLKKRKVKAAEEEE
jgi:hypothetical protein